IEHPAAGPSVRPVSVHPAESRAVDGGRAAGADHHDEPEPPVIEGQAARRERLSGESEGGNGDRGTASRSGGASRARRAGGTPTGEAERGVGFASRGAGVLGGFAVSRARGLAVLTTRCTTQSPSTPTISQSRNPRGSMHSFRR